MEKYIRAGNSRTYTGRPHPHHDKLSDASILVITTAGSAPLERMNIWTR